MKRVTEFKSKKQKNQKISMVTCYDHWSAKLLKDTDIDCLLVGDSLAMVVHGFDSTVHADIDMMALHTASVARAETQKLIVSDLPFLCHRQGKKQLIRYTDKLFKAGAQAVKIETSPGQESIIEYLTESGIPVLGHIGLTPQHVHQLGGYKVQGRNQSQAKALIQQAKSIESAGAHAIILECVPSELAAQISFDLEIPTIGIGAGRNVDGQVMVLHDLLGLNNQFKPRFVRDFGQGSQWLTAAIRDYVKSIHNNDFPNDKESFQ